ncbi:MULTISPECIES: NepR family anti-sigma factor [Sphingobium]|nr:MULTISPECIES: NepR family anti-sigma factor [Sphingobium]
MVTIGLPSPDEGIGRALRSVYCPVMQDGLPDDMLALLAQLDRH